LSPLLRLTAFRNTYFVRGLMVWIAIRLALGYGGLGDPNVVQEFLLLGAVGAAVLLDARRRREHLFLGNLGVPPAFIALCALPLAIIAELLMP
jgi:hypothetical protein